MAYSFDDTSSHRLTRSAASLPVPPSGSIWFYPDDNTIDCVIYSQYNGANTRFAAIKLYGSLGGIFGYESSDSSSFGAVTSAGTPNYNAWNHVYFEHNGTHAYISLNGETLVDGGASSWVAPGTVTQVAIGRRGAAVYPASNYFSGMIAEAAFWNNDLSSYDDRYQSLYYGIDPRSIAVESPLQLLSYAPLIGRPTDFMHTTPWTVSGATVANDHPRIHRQYME